MKKWNLLFINVFILFIACNSGPSGSDYIGHWEQHGVTQQGTPFSDYIDISVSANNFYLINSSYPNLRGLYSLTKEGNLTSSEVEALLTYDKAKKRLILSWYGRVEYYSK